VLLYLEYLYQSIDSCFNVFESLFFLGGQQTGGREKYIIFLYVTQ
jgi:hypothetical protein